MSSVTRDTSTTQATIWRRVESVSSYSGLGNNISFQPDVISVSYMLGGSTRFTDAQGVMFTPEGQYWMEAITNNPKVGDFIALGDWRNELDPSAVDTAKEIRKVELQDCSMLGEPDDFYIVT